MAPTVGSRRLVIIGAGGHGRELLDVVEAVNRGSNRFEFLGFIDDGAVDRAMLDALGASLLEGVERLVAERAGYIVGIGSGATRQRFDQLLSAQAVPALDLVHPFAARGTHIHHDEGLVMCSHSSITTNVRLGRHVHLNRAATIGHDSVIGDYVSLNPGAIVSGQGRLGDRVTLGTGAIVLEGRFVGADTVVGAGGVVTRDLPEGVVAVGCPARPVRTIDASPSPCRATPAEPRP